MVPDFYKILDVEAKAQREGLFSMLLDFYKILDVEAKAQREGLF